MADDDYKKLIIRLAMEEFKVLEGDEGDLVIHTGYKLVEGELVKV